MRLGVCKSCSQMNRTYQSNLVLLRQKLAHGLSTVRRTARHARQPQLLQALLPKTAWQERPAPARLACRRACWQPPAAVLRAGHAQRCAAPGRTRSACASTWRGWSPRSVSRPPAPPRAPAARLPAPLPPLARPPRMPWPTHGCTPCSSVLQPLAARSCRRHSPGCATVRDARAARCSGARRVCHHRAPAWAPRAAAPGLASPAQGPGALLAAQVPPSTAWQPQPAPRLLRHAPDRGCPAPQVPARCQRRLVTGFQGMQTLLMPSQGSIRRCMPAALRQQPSCWAAWDLGVRWG